MNRTSIKINLIGYKEVKPKDETHSARLARTGKSICKKHGLHSEWKISGKIHKKYRTVRQTAFCIPCKKEASKKSYLKDPEYHSNRSRKSWIARKQADIIKYKHETQMKAGLKRNKKYECTLDYLRDLYEKQGRKCAISGRPLTIENISLDRIDSSKNYTNDNVQWVVIQINRAKNVLAQSDFIQLCEDVVNHCKGNK